MSTHKKYNKNEKLFDIDDIIQVTNNKRNSYSSKKQNDTSRVESEKKDFQKTCNAELINSEMVVECKSELINCEINGTNIPITTPVVITELIVHINLENNIVLNRPAHEIKRINRKVLITECNLLPEVKKLFLTGKVIKNIEYSEAMYNCRKSMEGQLRNITVYAPFKCVTKVEYLVQPTTTGVSTNTIKTNFKTEESEVVFSDSYSEASKIYCQLVNASFQEVNIKNDRYQENNSTFKNFTQKMTMNLTLRLLQNQKVVLVKG